MMEPKLWPPQELAIEAALKAMKEGRTAGLWCMPTGTGKTRAFCTLASRLRARTLILVHREELAQQTIATLASVWPGASVGLVRAESNDWTGKQIVVATVQSLYRRLAQYPPDHFPLVVFDEAHHAAADSWQLVADHFTGFRLGATATPTRLDGRGLDDLFGEKPVYVYPLKTAIRDGYLVGIKQYAIETTVDLNGVANRGNDFAPEELAEAVVNEARTRAVVEAFLGHAGDRKTVAFCVSLKHVDQVCEAFQLEGVEARSVTGEMNREDRAQVLADFAKGRFQVLVNCQVLTEGYDERSIGCVLMARPTQSKALYQQMLGRGLRLCPEAGKEDCLVLDVVDNCRRHQLVTATSLLGVHKVNADGMDVLDLEQEEIEEQERALLERKPCLPPEATVHWTAQPFDPFGPDWEPNLLEGYEPLFAWHKDPATDGQLAALRRRGYEPPQGVTKGEANAVLSHASPKQRRVLSRRGLWHDGLSFDDASKLIDGVSLKEGWSTPAGGWAGQHKRQGCVIRCSGSQLGKGSNDQTKRLCGPPGRSGEAIA
jgi:superfamily II DNA or RNA helicase